MRRHKPRHTARDPVRSNLRRLLSSGAEVDFIVNDLECAIECKSSAAVQTNHLKGLRELNEEHPAVGRKIVVSREPKSRRTSDGIEILSVADFLTMLWAGELF